MPKGKTDLKDQEETKLVPLEEAVPDRKVIIGGNLSTKEEVELIVTLAKNKYVFAWSASDLQGVSRDIIQHSLDINPKMKPKKQKQIKMSEEKILAAKAEVQRLLDANVIREFQIFRVVGKHGASAEEEQKDDDVYRLHRSKRSMQKRSIPTSKDRCLHRQSCWL
jgi:hypothetical protein